MLKSIKIENFKSLVNTGEIDIKPITLLIGPNSSGKSSLIQFLLLLKQTAESRDVDNPLILNDEKCLELESYKNIIYKHNTKNNLKFEVQFDLPKSRFKRLKGKNINIKYSCVFYRKMAGKIGISELKIFDINNNKTIIFLKYDKKSRKYIVEDFFDEKLKNALQFRQNRIRFNKFLINLPYLHGIDIDYREIYFSTRNLDNFFSERICYIGPLRDRPKRYYPVSGATMKDVGFMGEKTAEVINSEKDVLEKVKEWFKKFELAENIIKNEKNDLVKETCKVCKIVRDNGLLSIPIQKAKSKKSFYDIEGGKKI